MTAAKGGWTPGPWMIRRLPERVEGVHVWIDGGPESVPICDVKHHRAQDEDARLIAAAPAMANVLARVAEHFENTDAPLGIAARAALRAARGEA